MGESGMVKSKKEDELSIEGIIKILGLNPLDEEGGMYRCVYEGRKDKEGLCISSSIYYLLDENTFSHMHKLESDEIYHYYMGDGLEILLLYPDGKAECKILGTQLNKGERPQILVPAGVWQGSRVLPGGKFCLVGTTMAPAYRQEEYIHGNMNDLIKKYPCAKEKIIERCKECK